jgi:hypothetical protein
MSNKAFIVKVRSFFDNPHSLHSKLGPATEQPNTDVYVAMQ